MRSRLDRRAFVRIAASGALGACACGELLAQSTAAAVALATLPLAPDVLLITGAGANVVVVAQPQGLLLVNGGHFSAAAALRALLREHLPKHSVQIVVNTGLWGHARELGGII